MSLLGLGAYYGIVGHHCSAEGAGNLLECVLGAFSTGFFVDWQLPMGFECCCCRSARGC